LRRNSGWLESGSTNAKKDWYNCLSNARKKHRDTVCDEIEANIAAATEKDCNTHCYFDALLASDKKAASNIFSDIYTSFKRELVPSSIELDLAFLIDITGSMTPYTHATAATIKNMLFGSGSIVSKLNINFPKIEFYLRVGVMGFRDVDDDLEQFVERRSIEGGHFVDNNDFSIDFVESILNSPSGGGDTAEDLLGAIDRSAKWNGSNDWTSPIKFMVLLTDAPAHGFSTNVPDADDDYSVCHPCGLTPESVADSLIKADIDLFICSYNPAATLQTEKELAMKYLGHRDNYEKREITAIPMVPESQSQKKHIIFVLDQSASMACDWAGVVAAYNHFIDWLCQKQRYSDLVSVVQFGTFADVTVKKQPILGIPSDLKFGCDHHTIFLPAAQSACILAKSTPPSHTPSIIFMSDGEVGDDDAKQAANRFSNFNTTLQDRLENELELNVIAFGSMACHTQLKHIANSSQNGRFHMSTDTAELSNLFVQIADAGFHVADLLEAEIGKRISDAVSDKLALEYIK